MISDIGVTVLWFALIITLVQGLIPSIGFYKKNKYLTATARPLVYCQMCFILIAYFFLTYAFATNDFTVLYVAANSHPDLPLMYRLTAVWGGHEGSILLWIFYLSLWTLIISFSKSLTELKPLIISILGLISFSFLAFLIFTSNPFTKVLGEVSPQDLNPLLQDPGFISHPPMLYAGYVGFAAAFAITLAALLANKLDASWARITRLFTLGAWGFLTLGITLGSWWAYRVLGWGGFWFWDPVENASLLPWLSGTALIHVLVIAERKAIAHNFAALLAIISFALSVLGTFLVRSGVLVSAHTFANDPARGVYLLLLFAIVMVVALAIYFIRTKQANKSFFSLCFSREMMLLSNSALFTIIMLTVLLGTLYPLILDAFKLGSISVGAPYFNLTMLPLTLLLMALMSVAPYSFWEVNSLSYILKLSGKNLIISFVISTLLFIFYEKINFLTALFLFLSFWLMLNIMNQYRIKPGMFVTHLGFTTLLLGVILSSALSEQSQVRMRVGESTKLGPYQFFFIGISGVEGSNYRGIKGSFEVLKNSRHITYLMPEKRIYPVREMIMTNVAIHPSIFRDLYLALGEPYSENDWSLRIYYKPFIRFIWFGGILMLLGSLISISNYAQRKRNAL